MKVQIFHNNSSVCPTPNSELPRLSSSIIQTHGATSLRKEWAMKLKQIHSENNLKDMSSRLLVDLTAMDLP